MYIKSIEVINVGPIENIKISFEFNNENPRPTVFVGSNGSGKSILLSFIVNYFCIVKQDYYDDTDTEKGNVFKLRSPLYIRSGSYFYYANLLFEQEFSYDEWQLINTRKQLQQNLQALATPQGWDKIGEDSTNTLNFNHQHDQAKINILKNIIDNSSIVYLPPNRFEEPAWLNIDNLNRKATIASKLKLSNISNRQIVASSSLDLIIDWLYDTIFAMHISEVRYRTVLQNQTETQPQTFVKVPEYAGQNTSLFEIIIDILKLIFSKFDFDEIKVNIGSKNNRRIGLEFYKQSKKVHFIPNIFSLSSGESLIFGMFCTILRDYDFSNAALTSPADLKGIAIIDEIDLHLHVDLQRNVLPKLIKKFPKVQFIITTHSPTFLIGMDTEIGENEYDIYEMPDGNKISSYRFKEFEAAYTFFKETKLHEEEMRSHLLQHTLPLVLTEGKTDVAIMETAWNKLFNTIKMPFVLISSGIESNNASRTGSAETVRRSLEYISTILNRPVIGLFDNDREGNEQFKGLNKKIFEDHSATSTTRKHRTKNIWGMLLPPPEMRKKFVTGDNIKYRYFQIEHYFSDDLLASHHKKGCPILDTEIFEIVGDKQQFSEIVSTLDSSDFSEFHVLFENLKNILSTTSPEQWPF